MSGLMLTQAEQELLFDAVVKKYSNSNKSLWLIVVCTIDFNLMQTFIS